MAWTSRDVSTKQGSEIFLQRRLDSQFTDLPVGQILCAEPVYVLRCCCRQEPYPTNQAKMQIMEESDVVANVCEPPHVADHCWRGDRDAAAGASHGSRTRDLAEPDGALCQRLPARGSNRYALAHSLPEDERTVRTVVRRREPGRGGRRAGGGCGGESAAGRIPGRPWRHRQQRACDRQLCQASL